MLDKFQRLTAIIFTTWSILAATAFCEVTEEQQTATHVEIKPIKFELGPEGKIETLAMDSAGNLLASISWTDKNGKVAPENQRPVINRPRPGGPRGRKGNPLPFEPVGPRLNAIKVISPTGRLIKTISLDSQSARILCPINESTLLIGGKGTLCLIDNRGKLKKKLSTKTLLGGRYAQSAVSGLAVSDQYFFVAFGDGFSLRASEDIVRFKHDFSEPKTIIEQQHGCCAHLDLDVQDDKLLVAENSRFRVNRYDFDGKQIDTWGERNRTSIEGFAACCNPVNFDFGPQNVLYTAESGIGRVKRFTSAGKFLGLAGYVDTTKFDRGSRLAAMSCYIPIEVSKDGKRIYILDIRANLIRVLAQK